MYKTSTKVHSRRGYGHTSTFNLTHRAKKQDDLITRLQDLSQEAAEANDLEMEQFLCLLLEYAEEPANMKRIFTQYRRMKPKMFKRLEQSL